ncbi:glycosyltransferase family 4 protein [Stygiobacter electus]|uniref:Glycosyltransferase family 4 protein n=1 Tax=Stygiobacter electus TaxID=3032292 RepID=A0AAE3P3G3_9BACT|nr:glycosyltransferase family 4 protein [Stygiobacter electus]MDF1613102.1 glycosyltransferase family 4 protein [Stygiobacter electus]
MKIIIHDLAAHPFIFQLSTELAKRGHIVFHLISTFFDSPNKSNLTCDNGDNLKLIQISIKNEYSKTNFIKRRKADIEYGEEIAKKISEIKPDIFINTISQLDSTKHILKRCKRENIKYISWVQDIYSLAIKSILIKKIPLIGYFIFRYYELLERNILKSSDSVIVISDCFKQLLIKWGINYKKIHLIPNWANNELIKKKSKTNEWSTKNGLDDKFVFLYAGTLGYKHNPLLLCELALFLKDYNEIRIVVISNGQGADILRKTKIEIKLENLILFDYQPMNQLSYVLSSADVLISILEKDAGIYSVPSKILSYLCVGRPLLLSVPLENQASKIVNENNMGIVVDPFDTNRFLSSALELYKNSALREVFSENAQKYSKTEFDIIKKADLFEEIINKV